MLECASREADVDTFGPNPKHVQVWGCLPFNAENEEWGTINATHFIRGTLTKEINRKAEIKTKHTFHVETYHVFNVDQIQPNNSPNLCVLGAKSKHFVYMCICMYIL